MEILLACPRCHVVVNPDDYFCANCGEKLKESAYSLPTGRIITVYLLSLLIPPTGYYFGIKYLKQTDKKARQVGRIAIILTSLSLVLTVISIVLSIKLAGNIIKLTNQDYLFNF